MPDICLFVDLKMYFEDVSVHCGFKECVMKKKFHIFFLFFLAEIHSLTLQSDEMALDR